MATTETSKKLPKQTKYTRNDRNDFIGLLQRHGMNIQKACDAFKTKYPDFSRRSYYNWLETDPDFKQVYDDLREAEIDEAETLHKLHRNGVPVTDEKGTIIGWRIRPSQTAIEFFLKTRGKGRGYGEEEKPNRVEIRVIRE